MNEPEDDMMTMQNKRLAPDKSIDFGFDLPESVVANQSTNIKSNNHDTSFEIFLDGFAVTGSLYIFMVVDEEIQDTEPLTVDTDSDTPIYIPEIDSLKFQRILGEGPDIVLWVQGTESLGCSVGVSHHSHTDFQWKDKLVRLIHLFGIPCILAITNKFAAGAHRNMEATNSVVEAHQAYLSTVVMVKKRKKGRRLKYWFSGTGCRWKQILAQSCQLRSTLLVLHLENMMFVERVGIDTTKKRRRKPMIMSKGTMRLLKQVYKRKEWKQKIKETIEELEGLHISLVVGLYTELACWISH